MPASERLRRYASSLVCAVLLCAGTASAQRAVDPDNPTCPRNPNWSNLPRMQFTLEEADGRRILRAEGTIDQDVVPRLREALRSNAPIDEIWLRSSGGVARAGNEAGRVIREAGLPTRIPSGWACFSACNFLFMGGPIRIVDPGGLFIVHMFTHTGDRETIRSEVARGEANTIGLIGDIEQQSALLASEDNDFLIRMGVSRLLLTEVMYQTRAVADAQDRATRRCLTQDEVYRYNVANVR
jgi:hypothetical protein